MKGVEMKSARRFDLAMEAFRDAIAKDKNFEAPYAQLLNLYEMFGFKDKLEKLNQDILLNLPESPLAGKSHYSAAEKSFETNQLDKAEENVTKALKIASQDLTIKARCFQLQQNIRFVKSQEGVSAEEIKMEKLSEQLNRFQLQYFPAMTADENFMIFTARKSTHELDDENIYVSRKVKGDWTAPQGISPLVNGRENEGTSSINADARIMVFTKCGSPEGQGSCDIFITERFGNQWKEPQPIREINSPNWDSHPSLSPDGRTIYFTSARPGGYGKMDIWAAEKDSNGRWQAPFNLGPEINTPYDEETPFIHANGQTLYFASDGHPGFGKIDLFQTHKVKNSWLKPKNLGRAINSYKDESGLFITASGKTGLFCIEERRDRDLLSSQIQIFSVPPSFRSGPVCTYLSGTIFDAVTKKRIQATVELVNMETGKTEFSMPSDKDFGTYMAVIKLNKPYGLFVSQTGYLFHSQVLHSDSLKAVEEGLKQDVYLEPIRTGASIVLNNLFFESGKADLLEASLVELRKVGKLLRLNPAMKIEISAHTDHVGTDNDNLQLSQRRAQAVVDNLIRQGIQKTRMIAKGYGESKPLNDNSTEEKRSLNRRIEFKVL
jgi:OOP family OmpA-OmpF porin